VELDQAVSTHGVVHRIDMSKVFRRRELTRVVKRVAGNIVVSQQDLLHAAIKVVKRGASVSEGCMAAHASRRQFVSQKQRIASSTGVEAGIHMEDMISLEQWLLESKRHIKKRASS
jgi:hypothetical protein